MKRFERRLPHKPEKVWRALTEPRELAQWFPEGARKITEWDPPRVLALTLGDENLRWELSPTPEGCLLVLTTEVVSQEAPANDNVTSFKCAA
ncbi:hypothetical protein LVJ94_29790 [Pendulispora rubella]|uniref:Polyketide cyclase n=1 Tax=Pendulispora rubella TaxID=2741070 RepID=A0ABZ2KRH0_9BACT